MFVKAESGVYEIRCKVNDKKYIGSARVMKRRWAAHKYKLNKGLIGDVLHHCPHLQSAWRLYGAENFEFLTVERCPEEVRLVREQAHIDAAWDSGTLYNAARKVEPSVGWLTAEACSRISLRQLGKKRGSRNAETRQKISDGLKGQLFSTDRRLKMSIGRKGKGVGRKNTPETILKMSLAATGRKMSDAARAKMSIAVTGRIVSEETRAKMSKARKGMKMSAISVQRSADARRNPSPETRARMAAAGRNISDETRARRSLSATGRKHSPEAIERIKTARAKQVITEETREKMRTSHLKRVAENPKVHAPLSDEHKAKLKAAANTPEGKERRRLGQERRRLREVEAKRLKEAQILPFSPRAV